MKNIIFILTLLLSTAAFAGDSVICSFSTSTQVVYGGNSESFSYIVEGLMICPNINGATKIDAEKSETFAHSNYFTLAARNAAEQTRLKVINSARDSNAIHIDGFAYVISNIINCNLVENEDYHCILEVKKIK